MCKGSCFKISFDCQRCNGSHTLLKSTRQKFHPILSLLVVKLSRKKSLLVRSEILGQFVNTMASNEKYSSHNTENLLELIQTQ